MVDLSSMKERCLVHIRNMSAVINGNFSCMSPDWEKFSQEMKDEMTYEVIFKGITFVMIYVDLMENESKSSQSLQWLKYPENKPSDDESILVSNIEHKDNSMWIRAYYNEQEDIFYSLDSIFAFPLKVTHFLRVPSLIKK